MTSKSKKKNKAVYSPTKGKILSINKPAGWTSFDVVNKIRRVTGIRKVGHAGTLDPFATGVLLVCLGPATKKVSKLMNLPKEYVADIVLGTETDTLDVTGKVITKGEPPAFSEQEILSVIPEFTGTIEQEIPSFSAAKHQGRRLYKLARSGKEVPRLFKTVEIMEIELLSVEPGRFTIRVVCGKGTYIRALAKDMAKRLNTVGYVQRLVRTRVGDYRIEDSLTPEEFETMVESTKSL